MRATASPSPIGYITLKHWTWLQLSSNTSPWVVFSLSLSCNNKWATCIYWNLLYYALMYQIWGPEAGVKFFFSQLAAGLTNRVPVRDSRAGAPLNTKGKNLPNVKLKQNLKISLHSNCLQHLSRINGEVIILIYAEFYDAELHFARILRAVELSPSSSAMFR